ncbi:MAG: hypothetical protein F6K25_19820 [Okeania sp. SIO2G4]|uniref:hypothetical protein n=1 Tax=unclassified Okeania TaxID=2634635 RepID=UPI0013B75859|nr:MULTISPECIES: hypothetical protein [unclassified Okeania]NEP07632.1 hypothetical protein [Okeania sp. SIO4D6]NEP70406.1 hypothetical protein [Okeania sp. SIO2G5]NEP91640.1 hypothetical protein [Okeania sp. SIO2F5]NEQ92795.1 hypothetical protein [Okeania sp. SIO2G4]
MISCPVASVLYSKGKEEGRRKKEEGRRKREEGYPRKKKPSFPVDIHPWVYTNDINGHDMILICAKNFFLIYQKFLLIAVFR